jgi:methylphosphotriester-DNA--protein-cysteine methyltransferase
VQGDRLPDEAHLLHAEPADPHPSFPRRNRPAARAPAAGSSARLGHAQGLLEPTDLTVQSVARRCGPGSAGNFRAVFREHLGVPPSGYRESFRATDRDAATES